MPSFKPKATKKIGKKTRNNSTVDSKHQEKMNEFKITETTLLPTLIKQKTQIKKKLKTVLNIEEELELKDQLKQIRIDIKIKKKMKKNYLLDNVEHVFNYFEKKRIRQKEKIKTEYYIHFLIKIKMKIMKK